MSRFFVIGDGDTCAGFGLAGIAGVTPGGLDEAAGSLATALGDSGISIIVVTEDIARGLAAQITEHRLTGAMPMIVEIPGNLSGEFSGPSLLDSIRQAVGVSV